MTIAGLDLDPAEVLQQSDPDAYQEKLLEWNDEREESLLATLSAVLGVKGNGKRFAGLKKISGKGLVIPFVGAGLSVPCGIPTWENFVRAVREHLNESSVRMEEALADGDLELAAEIACDEMGAPLFWERVEAHLGDPDDRAVRGPVLMLPELFDGPCATTNLDRHIETAYGEAGKHIDDVLREAIPQAVSRLIVERRRMLLKIHGDELYKEGWVLHRAQYEARYGPRDSPDLDRPLPHALAAMFTSSTILFLGCSLVTDRTLRVFRAVCDAGGLDVPTHYAILEMPETQGEWDEREIALTALNIFPIWFPKGDYDAVEAVLLGLTR